MIPVPGRPGWQLGDIVLESQAQELTCSVFHQDARVGLHARAKTETALRAAAVAAVDDFYDRRAKELPLAEEYVRLV